MKLDFVKVTVNSVKKSSNHLNCNNNLITWFNTIKRSLKVLERWETPIDILLKDKATPVVHPPRRVPFKIKEDLIKTLDDLVAKNTIAPVTEANDWVSSMVLV